MDRKPETGSSSPSLTIIFGMFIGFVLIFFTKPDVSKTKKKAFSNWSQVRSKKFQAVNHINFDDTRLILTNFEINFEANLEINFEENVSIPPPKHKFFGMLIDFILVFSMKPDVRKTLKTFYLSNFKTIVITNNKK